jgi:S1-C subfamily serine protease
MALIPPFFSDCVVAVGVPGEKDAGPTWIGSAFFYGRPVGEDEADGKMRYAVYLVSNKHVFGEQRRIVGQANPQSDDPEAAAQDFHVDLQVQVEGDWQQAWFGHPDASIDVAVARVNLNALLEAGMRASFFAGDQHVLRKGELASQGVTEGDFVFVLGYPMGLVGEHRSVVIVRSGNIARIRDALAGTETGYLVDATAFPGNSGGPVVLKPEIVSIQGTAATNKAALIGIVRAYVPYRDVAISVQTQQPRVVFEENSGLVAAHFIDAVDECIDTDPRFMQQSIVEEPTPAPAEEGDAQEAQVSQVTPAST